MKSRIPPPVSSIQETLTVFQYKTLLHLPRLQFRVFLTRAPKNKVKHSAKTQQYVIDTFNILFNMITKAGYKKTKHRYTSLNEFFAKAKNLAAADHGVKKAVFWSLDCVMYSGYVVQ
eukprot:gb/GEZJ01006495.1/.p1 GENE.gb/GEZJ01006495.1/~~gb/GEZJ01006495.1/.p1  ORF type:complete len:117 (-),score=3.82 gb/GEZJ01006495.1/:18-368(-)